MDKQIGGSGSAGSELFIVDNSDQDWKALQYVRDWSGLPRSIDIATGFCEIGALLGLDGEWQKVDHIRILKGEEVSQRTKKAFAEGPAGQQPRGQKEKNDFLADVPAIVEAIRSRKIECRVYRKRKFHAKAYITHARAAVVGAFSLVASSNFRLAADGDPADHVIEFTARCGHHWIIEDNSVHWGQRHRHGGRAGGYRPQQRRGRRRARHLRARLRLPDDTRQSHLRASSTGGTSTEGPLAWKRSSTASGWCCKSRSPKAARWSREPLICRARFVWRTCSSGRKR